MVEVNASTFAADCVTAARKSLVKHVGADVKQKSEDRHSIEFIAEGGKKNFSEVAQYVLRAMVKASCGSEKGTTKIGSGEVLVDATAAVVTRPFNDVVQISSFNFKDLPTGNREIASIAEATYIRHVQKHSELCTQAISDFPPCLLFDNATTRLDVSIGGCVVFSLISGGSGSSRIRFFVKPIETAFGGMCSASFASGVLPKRWFARDTLTPPQLSELLDEIQEAVSVFWEDSAQDAIAKTEVTFLFTTVGSGVCQYFRERLDNNGGAFRGDRSLVEQAQSFLEEWHSACQKLMTIDWRSSWDERFEDTGLLHVKDRLTTVLVLRDVLREMQELLEPDEFRSLKTESLWDAFGAVDIFNMAPAAEKQWGLSLATFYRRLEAAEHRCAATLKNFFASRSSLAPQTVLSEFSHFRQLVRRPIIAKELVSEREGFLAKLSERLQALQLEFEHRSESTEDELVLEEEDRRCQAARFMPGVVNNVIWLRQLRSRVEEMIQMCESVLSDLRHASEFTKTANQILEDVADYEQETYKNWVLAIQDDSDALTLNANATLMDINAEGHVEVNYSERLVQLIKEVRIFNALGFRVPDDVARIAKQGVQFYQRGLALKQVANTYNSMSKDIIPSTSAMLLEPAVAFEKVIDASGSSKLTWRSEEEADRFIKKLRHAAQMLTDDNRRLHKLHREIQSIVLELFRVDLLRSRERWVSKVRMIREKMETSGFRNMDSWKVFWDMQLYKALESQYQLGLESLGETVSEIKADIVIDPESGVAALRPPLESIRQQYFQNIKDFINFPNRLHGCSGPDVFKAMPARNERGIYSVMHNASNLFRSVQQELRRFTPLLAIGRCGKAGNPPLERIVEQSLTEVQHWEQGIRLLKQRGKEINSLDLFIKCGCITLCTAAIKGTVEEHLSRLAEALKTTLKHSAERHLAGIDAYLQKVLQCLDSKLTKLDEIGQANILYAELMEQRPAKEVEFHHFFNKNLLLQSMTGAAGLDFTKTKDNWDRFMNRLDYHEKEVEEQLNKLQTSVAETLATWQKDVERFSNQWNELKPTELNAESPLEFVSKKREELQALKETGEECVKQCRHFQLDDPDMQPIEDVAGDIEDYFNMWSMLGSFQDELQGFTKESWISFRSKIFRFEDFVKLWQDKLKEIPSNPVTVHIRTTLDQWGRCVPLLKFLRGEGFTPLHWNELFSLLQLRGVTQDTVTFGQLLDKYTIILQKEAEIKKLHSRAQGEAQIREALDEVRAWGTNARFALSPHPDRAGVMLIVEWKDTMSALSDNQALLVSMKESPYFAQFSSDANKWEERLSTLDEYLRHMNSIQRRWVYLDPIFRRGALPKEQERFSRIDKEYLIIMQSVQADSRLLSLAAHKEFKAMLLNVLEQLERCQKSLNQYLEEKRNSFPRFYFISDDDLLEILAQSRSPTVIQSHLKKLFMGIHTVQFDAPKENIIRVLSMDGEVVNLRNPVRMTDVVESWLTQLDSEVKATLKTHLIECVAKMDIGLHASQILCAAQMVNFTKRTEEAILEGKGGVPLKKYQASLQAQLRELTAFSGGTNDALVGLKVKALIMDLIHNIEVVGVLIENNVDKESDWLWRKQLRYYIDRSDTCVLKMVDAQFNYSYEYQGNAPKLVHTPLTDRCYLTLTQGMQLGYGGNPYGPAGTGKTESVKALGNAMGRQVLVFNCDEGIDFKSMGRIFIGLVKCGAWGCFDEFNRLKVDQLSAISQMIQIIQEALKAGEAHCHLLGRDIDVNPNAGIFVTMNPAGKGYGGRSKLPDNLKQLFRSIAMSVPDNELITETILFSEGFENARDLARRTVEIFSLSKQLLSYQQHYDWGLRAMKSVLRLGGTLVHSFLMTRVAGKEDIPPNVVLQKESEIIIKSLRVNTLSKLTYDDAILFNNLIADVFPDVPVLEIDYKDLRTAIVESISELNLQLVDTQVQKTLQLYEALRQRMGVVLVGPSGSGKSTLLKVLRKALQRLRTTVPLYVVNPKALPRDQLLGHMDADTREWFDGVLTDAARKVVKEDAGTRSWILCDGDIDPEWVESLNSVLDDNKLLTMPNGVRIQFGDNVNFLFETHSLEFASPATVSRMGIIYLSEQDVDPRTAVASWLLDQPEESRSELKTWIDNYLYKAMDALVATEKLVVSTTQMGITMSALSQLQGCTTKSQFALALIYGLGSYLPDEKRRDYAKDVLYLTGERAPDAKNPLDFKYDIESGTYIPLEFEPALDLTVDDLYHNPMVVTVDCQRALDIMRAWSQPLKGGSYYRPFILVGPEGCGKSMLLTNFFLKNSSTRVATVNCSAQTEAIHVIQKLKQACQLLNSNQGKVLRPKDTERLVLLVKDLNLPKPDKYGTVQLHSFLQQLILYRGFYDADLEWVTVERVQVVGSMTPPGSMGRYPVAPRFLAITSVLSVSYPSRENLFAIYTEFFNVMTQSQRLQMSIPGKGTADIARMLTTVYEIISSRCTVDMASHYVFNPRDITKWTLNLLNYNPSDLADALGYEGQRIFVDRLVTAEERSKLLKVIKDNLSAVVGHRDAPTDKETRFYVSWMDSAPPGKKKLMATDMKKLAKAAEESLLNYSREFSKLNIQLIPEVCAWMSRVDRVLSQERGHLLLIGRAGVCASEMVRLVAYNNRTEVVTLGITREYGMKQFNLELKSVMTKAGVEGQSVVLLLEQFNFFNAQFLEAVNSILSSGEVPGLFTAEEQEVMLGPLKEDAIAENMTAYAYLTDRIARRLHVVVIMDPTNRHYETQCRANPALFTRCNVYWMGTWDSGSLKMIPRLLMPDVYTALDAREDKKEFSLTTELVHMHRGFGDRFPPQLFKALCLTYARLFQQKSRTIVDGLARLKSGVSKIDEAQASIDKIASDVAEKKSMLEVKQQEADEALRAIQSKMEEAGEQKRGIQKIQKSLAKEEVAVVERKAKIEEQLSGIQPTLDAALSAVSSIRSEHLTELKSMKQPPAAVQDVMEGVILLTSGTKGTAVDWAAIRKVLAGDIKGQILNYNIDSVSETSRAQVEKFMATKSNSFKREVIGRASKAAAPMAEWLKAVIEYSKVLQTVAPLREQLKEYEANLRSGQEKKQKLEGKLGKVEKKVGELKNKFGEKTTEAERLKNQLEQAEGLLARATELLSKLSGEHSRWTAQMKTIDADLAMLPKRCLLAAGFITYLGKESEDVRRDTVSQWSAKVKLPDFDFFQFLREASVQLHLKAEGLPGDELSMDNAIIIEEQVHTPLIEDPAGQAINWLLNHLQARKEVVEVCSTSDERLVSSLELAMRFGKKFILTDVDQVEPFMYPILRKELHSEAGTKSVIQIGDRRTVDYSEKFQLYLVTRAVDLRVSPDIASHLTPVSFSITQSGLEGQFLGVTIQHEQPELEHEKRAVLKKEEQLKIQLAELEESLLSNLASSTGSLLENDGLIESLNQIKTQASEISGALEKSKQLQDELDVKRDVYRPFATIASRVFFLTKTLRSLSHMYQFSFNLFMDLFTQTLKHHKELRTDPETKLAALKETFIQTTVASVSRALLQDDRAIFGIHLARALFPSECTQAEWDFFLDKTIATEVKRQEVRVPTFVAPDSVVTFQSLAALFPELMAKLRFQEADVWLQWMRTSTPEADYPSFLQSLTHFQRLLVVKTLRSDRLIAAMNNVACELLRVSSLSDSGSLASIIDTTASSTPLLFITTAGADPSQELQSTAFEKVGRSRFHQLAMGGGQTEEAMQLLRTSAAQGDWLFLKNLHLVVPWVVTLQKELNTLSVHDNFRLFLTTEAHDEFPSVLLSHSLKITFEAPPGIKQNLLRTYSDWGKSYLQSVSDKQRDLLFIAAAMQAVIQERRSYVPQGWSKAYEVTASDLKSSADIVLRQSRGEVDWRSIRGLLDSAIYGGKMETAYDARILNVYIHKFFNPNCLPRSKRQDPLFFTIRIPPGGKHGDYVKAINSLPDNDIPVLFGLPPNADRVVQLTRVREMILHLQRMNEAEEETAQNRDEWAAHLTPVLQSWGEFFAPHAEKLTQQSTPQGSAADANPIDSYMSAELTSALRLVSAVDSCVEDLRRVIDGAALLTENRRAEAACMLQGGVPPQWDGHFACSAHITVWMQSLLRRAVAIHEGYTMALNSSLLRNPLNLANFFRPKTFLNALRQDTAHTTKQPLVSLVLVATTSRPPQNAPLSVELEGLLLQGAILDDADVLQPIETADESASFPIKKTYVAWMTNYPKQSASVKVPVYANATKEDYICDFVLPCATELACDNFVLAGVSIVLEP